MPGARPMMASRALRSPKEGTGALNQRGSRARLSLRKATSLGQSGQSRPGSVGSVPPDGARAVGLVVEVVAIAPRRHGGRALQELRRVVARLTWGWAFRRVAAELGLQLDEIG